MPARPTPEQSTRCAAWPSSAASTGCGFRSTQRTAACRPHEARQQLLSGLERADSVTLDPHKWLYQPIECGCVLVRQPHQLERAFSVAADYLDDYRGGEIDFGDRGLQLTRGARALKVWLSLQYFGVEAFAAAIDRALDLARLAESMILEHPELELLSPATLGVVCLRRRPAGVSDEEELERLNAELVARLKATGFGFTSSTRLDGRYAIRMCVMNHTTAAADVRRSVLWLANAPVRRGHRTRPERSRFLSATAVSCQEVT